MQKTTTNIVKISWMAVLVLMGFKLTARAQDFPDGTGKDKVQEVCSQCHGLKQVATAKLTPEEWKDVVNDMVARGAPLMEDEIPVVIDYLAKSFPKSKLDEKINVNKAVAKELVDTLHLTADEADALVKYRDENGYFHSWDDLGKVAGLDLKKLEPMKDKLTY